VSGLEGQVAIVTGASRGIGFATAVSLARRGAKVILVARNREMLARAAAAIGTPATMMACDLTDRTAVEDAIAEIQERFAAPSIVVNNAGVFRIGSIETTPAEHFEQALQVNLLAPFVFIRGFLPAMRARGSGHIVTIGSIADRMVFPGNSAYSATKFGARAMHEVLRAELKGSGVRATLISPGPVNTDIWDPVDPDNTPGFTKRAEMLSPEAVAVAVEFAVTRPPEVNVDELRLSRS
jgi:NADP-dependent 3-hydroxy acid dehydrogenase YdfG